METKHDYCLYNFINSKLLTLNNARIVKELVKKCAPGQLLLNMVIGLVTFPLQQE